MNASTDVATSNKNIHGDTTLKEIAKRLEKAEFSKILELISDFEKEKQFDILQHSFIYLNNHGKSLTENVRIVLHDEFGSMRFYSPIYTQEIADKTKRKSNIVFMKAWFDALSNNNITNASVKTSIQYIAIFADEFIYGEEMDKQLPWNMLLFYLREYSEYCTSGNKRHLFQVTLVTKDKFMEFLNNFKSLLEKLLKADVNGFRADNQVMTDEIRKYYSSLKDLHSFQKMMDKLRYFSTTNYYGWLRILQVIGEYVKRTDQTPNISEESESVLLKCLPQSLQKIKKFRDKVSHLRRVPECPKDCENLRDLIIKLESIIQWASKYDMLKKAVEIKSTILADESGHSSLELPHALTYELSSFPPSLTTLNENSSTNSKLRENNVNRLFSGLEYIYKGPNGYDLDLLDVTKEDLEKLKTDFHANYKLEASEEKLLNDLVTKTEEECKIVPQHEDYISSLEILQTQVANKDDLAVEYILMIILKYLDGEEPKKRKKKVPFRLNTNTKWHNDAFPTLLGRQLRNVLAHGNLIADMLQITTKTAIYSTANMLLEELHIEKEQEIKNGIMMIEMKTKYLTRDELSERRYGKLSILEKQEALWDHIENNHYVQVKQGIEAFKMQDNEWCNAPDSSVLHIAAGNKDDSVALFELVLDNVDWESTEEFLRDTYGNTVLHIAAEKDNSQIAEYILGRDELVALQDKMHKNYNGETPFHMAAFGGHLETLKILCNSWFSKYLTLFNENGQHAIHSAIVYDKIEIVQHFLEWNYDRTIDSVQALYGQTCLHLACAHNRNDIMRYLIEHGSNCNKPDRKKKTPLTIAGSLAGIPLREMMEGLLSDYNVNSMHNAVKEKSVHEFENIYNRAPYLLWTSDDYGVTPLDSALGTEDENLMESIFSKVLSDYSERPHIFKEIIAQICNDSDGGVMHVFHSACGRKIWNIVLNTMHDFPSQKLLQFWGFKLTAAILKHDYKIYNLKHTILSMIKRSYELFAKDDRMVYCFLEVLQTFEENELNDCDINYICSDLSASLSKTKYINHQNTLNMLSFMVKRSTVEQRNIKGYLIEIMFHIENPNFEEMETILDILYNLTWNNEQNTIIFLKHNGPKYIFRHPTTLELSSKNCQMRLLCNGLRSKKMRSYLSNSMSVEDLLKIKKRGNNQLVWSKWGMWVNKCFQDKQEEHYESNCSVALVEEMQLIDTSCKIPYINIIDWLLDILCEGSHKCQYWAAWTILSYTANYIDKIKPLIHNLDVTQIINVGQEVRDMLTIAVKTCADEE